MRYLVAALIALALAASARAQVTGLSAPLVIEAQDTLAQRNGTNAQELRVYTTFTDSVNYQRLSLVGNTGTANTVGINAASAGTGGNIGLQFGAGGAWRWQISASGHLLALSDNATDIGASGASRPRDVYVGRDLIVAAGGSTATFKAGGVLFLEANNVANSSTLAQTLHTYTVPANVLTVNGKTLRVTTMFATVNNANAKAVQINVCGSLVASLNTTASIAGSIRIETLITRTGLNTQAAQVTAVEGINSSTLTQAKQSATYNIALACTETATFTINANVNTAALSDASSSFHMVELLN